MKKILTALLSVLALSAIIFAAACGDDDDDSAEAASDQSDAGPEQDPGLDATESPPLLYLEAGDERLEGAIGNFQWVGVIADAFAIVTSTEPSEVAAGPITLTTSDTPFQGGTLTVFAAEGLQPETVPDGSVLRWSAFEAENAPALTAEVGPDGEADLSSLEPGNYLVSFFGNWEEGYAEYGFYVEIV